MIQTEGLIGKHINDPSELCTHCGLCCIVLRAVVEQKETDLFLRTAKQKGFGPSFCERFYKVEKDQLLIDMPCPFLEGKVLQRTACLAHSLPERPSVCQRYLCKVAIKYQLGLITVREGQQLLRASLVLGEASIFNWIGSSDPSEEQVIRAMQASEVAAALRHSGADDEVISLITCSNLIPTYEISSTFAKLVLGMFLFNVDKGNIDAEMFLDVSEFGDQAKQFADRIVQTVMSQIRSLFREVGIRTEMGPRDSSESSSTGEAPVQQ